MDFATLAFDRALSSTGEDRDVFALDKLTMRHFDIDGRLHVERCHISKANVCPYFGREIPNYQALGLNANQVYKLYRDPEELAKGAHTFRNLQLLIIHTGVNADKPKPELTIGTIGNDVEFDAPYLKASLAVWTAEAIKLIETKKQAQLSASYRYRAEMVPGITPTGVAFDGIMRDIVGNHVALVENGRAGPDVYVNDSTPLEFLTMKHSAALAALAALGVTLNSEQTVALDASIEKEIKAAADEKEEEEKKKKAAEDEKIAKDAKRAKDGEFPKAPEGGAPKPAMDSATVVSVVDAALAGKDFISRAQAEQMANDAAGTAVQRVNALHKARKDVEPLVGVVAFDSAEAVYGFALKEAKVNVEGVPPAAYGALVGQVIQRRAPTAKAPVTLASDTATVSLAHTAVPGLTRIQQA